MCNHIPCPTFMCPLSTVSWAILFALVFLYPNKRMNGQVPHSSFPKRMAVSVGLVSCASWTKWSSTCNIICSSLWISSANTMESSSQNLTWACREAKSLHDHNPFQEVQVQLLVYGSKMFSRHCTSSHEKSPVRHCSWCVHWWCWNFFSSWEYHTQLLSTMLWHLQDSRFTVNPLKCEWAVQEMNWLGYWLTPHDKNHGKRK